MVKCIFVVINKGTRPRCKISKVKVKDTKLYRGCFTVFIFKLEQISLVSSVYLLLTLNIC